MRVHLINDEKSNRLVSDSLTAEDGTYNIGDVRPGRYILQIDIGTVPATYEISEPKRIIEVAPTRQEFQEITLPDFILAVKQEQPGQNHELHKP